MNDPFGWEKYDGRGRPLPPPPENQVFAILGSVFMSICGVAFIVILLVQARPWDPGYRDRGIQVIEAELQRLPPPPGIEVSSVDITNTPTKSLTLDAYYPLPEGGCPAVTAYYVPLLHANVWLDGDASQGTTTSSQTFLKEAQGYHLRLSLDCDFIQGYYDLGFTNEAGFPFF